MIIVECYKLFNGIIWNEMFARTQMYTNINTVKAGWKKKKKNTLNHNE